MKTKSTIVFLALAAIGSLSVSQAALVINFDPAAITLNRPFDTDTTTSDTIIFNTTTPIFNGAASSGRKFYGGFSGTSGGINGVSTVSISGTNLNATTAKTASGTLTNKFFAFYDSTDFEIAGNTTLDLTAASSFSLAGAKINPGGTSFVIRDGSTYYISQSDNTGSNFTYTLNGAALTWAAFNPANWAGFTHGTTPAGLGVGATGSFASLTFTNVTGVGYILGAARGNTGSNVLNVTDFQVNLVPEPSAALLGGLGMLALLRRRRNA